MLELKIFGEKKTHRLFKWAEYEELPTINEDSTATYLLFVLIQNEGKFVQK